jgi:DNA polymerase III sliding clamp (beta) subunit (PCNA family)
LSGAPWRTPSATPPAWSKAQHHPGASNVLLEAGGDSLKVTATDLELQLEQPVPAQVGEAGAVTVGAALLQAIVRELPDGQQIDLSSDEGAALRIISGRARYKLPTLPAGDFPVMALADDAIQFTMPAAALRGMLAKVAHAVSTDATRYYSTAFALRPTPARWWPRRLMARRLPTPASRRPRVPPKSATP